MPNSEPTESESAFEAHWQSDGSAIDYQAFRHHRSSRMAHWRRTAEWRLFQGGTWLGKRLPLEQLQTLGKQLGRIALKLFPKERGIAQTQLAHVFPEASGAQREAWLQACFENFGQLLFEFLGMDQIDQAAEERLIFENEDALQQALAQQKGVILLGLHLGNWELINIYSRISGVPMSASTTNVPDPRLNEAIRSIRERGALKLISRGDPHATRKLLRCFQDKEVFVLAIDQDTNVPSHWVPFFNLPAKTPQSAAALALRTGAPVVNYLILREPNGRFRLRFENWGSFTRLPEVDDAQNQFLVSLHLNRQMEALLRTYPDQWAWFHRRWRHQPTPEELDEMKTRLRLATSL